MTQQQKLPYDKPTLTPVGSFEAVTQHATTGHALDATFTAGTTMDQLTFSDPPPKSN
jgi:hypothetical protein